MMMNYFFCLRTYFKFLSEGFINLRLSPVAACTFHISSVGQPVLSTFPPSVSLYFPHFLRRLTDLQLKATLFVQFIFTIIFNVCFFLTFLKMFFKKIL